MSPVTQTMETHWNIGKGNRLPCRLHGSWIWGKVWGLLVRGRGSRGTSHPHLGMVWLSPLGTIPLHEFLLLQYFSTRYPCLRAVEGSASAGGGRTCPLGTERLCPVLLQRMRRQLVSLSRVFHRINQHSGFSFDPLVFLKEFTQPLMWAVKQQRVINRGHALPEINKLQWKYSVLCEKGPDCQEKQKTKTKTALDCFEPAWVWSDLGVEEFRARTVQRAA